MKLVTNLILFIVLNVCNIYGYGENFNSHPSWIERESLVMMNSLRMEPKYYKQYFMQPFNFTNLENVITTKYYEKVEPLEYNVILNQMSRAHSVDLATSSDCFTFDNCNYTSFYSRIEHWKCDENTQEHIYKTTSSNNAFKAINRLVCRNSQNCLNDDDPDVGDFRDRIMGKQIFYSGTGIIYNSTLKTWFYTMDFTQTSCSPSSNDDKSIISASHTFKYENDNEVLFLANFYNSNETIQSFRIYLNQMNYKMNLLYSSDNYNSSNGVYSYNTRIFNRCDYYYFKVTTNSGKQIRYPTTGYLRIVDFKDKCESWSIDMNDQNSISFYLNNENNLYYNNSNSIDINNDQNITTNNTISIYNFNSILFMILFIFLFI